MENFEWNVGTRILFGRGQLDRLPEAIRAAFPDTVKTP